MSSSALPFLSPDPGYPARGTRFHTATHRLKVPPQRQPQTGHHGREASPGEPSRARQLPTGGFNQKPRLAACDMRAPKSSPPAALGIVSSTSTASAPAPMSFKDVLGFTVMRCVWFAQVISLPRRFPGAVCGDQRRVLHSPVRPGGCSPVSTFAQHEAARDPRPLSPAVAAHPPAPQADAGLQRFHPGLDSPPPPAALDEADAPGPPLHWSRSAAARPVSFACAVGDHP